MNLSTHNDKSSWGDLSRIGGITLRLSAILFVLYAATTFYLGPYPYASEAGVAGFISRLYWTGSNYSTLTIALSAQTAAIALIIPSLIALYVTLVERNKTYTPLGSILLGAGVLIFLSNVAQSFAYLSEANSYNQCNSCQPIALMAATSTSSVIMADLIAFLLIAVGLILLSWIMTREFAFGKAIGYLGIAIGVSGIVGSLVLSLTNNYNASFYFTPIILIIFAIWEALVGFRLSPM